MDLQRIVGGRPGDPRADQLGHAGLQIAALVLILAPGGEIGELARAHDLRRHHRQLVGDAREVEDRPAELLAVERVGKADVERRLGDADGAGSGLDTGAFEGCHQLLEALALDSAEQIGGGHAEIVEADLIFLHAAIADHLDFAAAHAGRGEGGVDGAALLGRDQHRQAAIVAGVGIGADQQGHHVGAGRMGDPGLVAADPIFAVGERRARAQRAKVGAGVRLCKDGGRQDRGIGDLREPMGLLLGGTAGQDQFCRDFRPGGEAADADPAARQFFRHDAHRGLAHAKAAKFLRNGHAEHAHLAQFLDQRQRDEFVLEMPFMGERRDLLVR